MSIYAEWDLAQLIKVSPALGFVSKAHFSARAISDVLERADS